MEGRRTSPGLPPPSSLAVTSTNRPTPPFSQRVSAEIVAPASSETSLEGVLDPGKAVLSRELADLLVELSIAMQKHAIYPRGHPLLNSSDEGVFRKISLLLADRPSLSLGIARRQLIIEGVATDPNHPLLKELAARLHKHNLGAIKFSQGLLEEELKDALATVAVDAGRVEEPLGDKAEELSERWQHIRLFPLHYDRLELQYEGSATEGEEVRVRRARSTKSAQLWVGMARAALMLDEDAEVGQDDMSPLVVAEAIDKRQKETAYDQVIVGYMLQIADELKNGTLTPEALELQKRISDMVQQLNPSTLRHLLKMGGDFSQRRQFLLDSAQGMTVDAVLDLVQAAAETSGQSISHSMMRLFSKLARYSDTDPERAKRSGADVAAREAVQRLMEEWQLDDPNPTVYGKVLHQMSRASRMDQPNVEYTEIEPERILQMAFELGVTGPRFDAALEAMVNSARIGPILDLLEAAPDPEFANTVWQELEVRDVLWIALAEARLDFPLLARLMERKRMSAIEPILDVAEASDRATREKLLELLLPLGNDVVGQAVARRIEGASPDIRRDLFLLLGKLSTIPPGFDGSRYLLHQDASVRREAIRLLLKFAETREQAIIAGCADTDERAVYLGMSAAQEGYCPPRAAEIVHERIEKGDLDPSLTTLAIRVLAAAESGATAPMPKNARGRASVMLRAIDTETQVAGNRKSLDWLMSKVASKSRFLGRWKLNQKSPEMLAALGALASYWNADPDVQEIIALATKTKDPDFRKALASQQRVTGKFKAIPE
jgi:hypothetical protein